MSNEEKAFLATIRDNPDDQMPRLAYADWCLEGGREYDRRYAARAEFIRTGIALYNSVDQAKKRLRKKWTEEEHHWGLNEAELAQELYGEDHFILETLYAVRNAHVAGEWSLNEVSKLVMSCGFVTRATIAIPDLYDADFLKRFKSLAHEPIRKLIVCNFRAERIRLGSMLEVYALVSYPGCNREFSHDHYLPYPLASIEEGRVAPMVKIDPQIARDQSIRASNPANTHALNGVLMQMPNSTLIYTFPTLKAARLWLEAAVKRYLESFR